MRTPTMFGTRLALAVVVLASLLTATLVPIDPVDAQGGGTTILPPNSPLPPNVSCNDLFNSDDGILFGTNLINAVSPCTFPSQCPGCFGIFSIDPNDKVGSSGAASFLAGAEPLRYAVFFENLGTASAAAQEVVITDPLDVASMDLATFSLGPIRVRDRSITPVPGLSSFAGDIDLRPGLDIIARVQAALDATTGVVSWRFTSIDPATGQPTTNPVAGFLPPNVTSPAGEGSVLFSVLPKTGITTGTQVCNRARIVFDVNAPIDTPAWCTLADNTAPVSRVTALPATQSATTFTVQWSGSDTGAGVQSFNVFVAENAGAFAPFRTNTTATSASFTGVAGRTYGFFSVATDRAGNTEHKAAAAEASTRLLVQGDVNGDGVVNCTDLAIVKAAFGKKTGQAGFDARADVNKDGIVNVLDLAFVSQKLPAGTKCP